jgi:hypothetical protein
MTRDEKVALVESFLDCVVRKELDRLPITPGYAAESPMSPRLSGQAAVEYLRGVAAGIKGIQIKQHIVEGDQVATLFEEDTIYGLIPVFAQFQIESGRIGAVRVFYDPRKITGSR